MVTREILDSHPASTLKKEISKTNIKGYSKMKKKQLIDVMMANKERFGHIKKKEYAPPKRTKKVMAKPKADTEPKRPSEPKRPTPPKKEKPKIQSDYLDFLRKKKKGADTEPKKRETLPQYDKTTATAVADELVKDLKKQGKQTYEIKTRSADNVRLYLSQNVPKIKSFASKISAGGLAGAMRHKSVKGVDEVHSRDFIADLLEKGKIVK